MKRRLEQRGSPANEGMAVQSRHFPDPLDALLAQHRPFGDSDYLHEQLQARYHARLGQISKTLPIAGELSRALEQATPYTRYRIVGDPVLRHTIHRALHLIWKNAQGGGALAECEAVLQETLGHLKNGHRGGPLESGDVAGRRLGIEACHGAIWSEKHPDDLFGRAFRRIVHDNFHGDPLCTPSAVDIARLAKGAKLLGELLPLSAQSVFSHTHMIVIVPDVGVWRQKASCSEFFIGGTIFLNRNMLVNPWWVAEHLFHESLHQKLYDLRHTHSLLAEDLSPDKPSKDTAAAVRAIWNVGGADRSNGWDTFRAVAAFHVYVHLAVLCTRAEQRQTELVKRFGAPAASLPAMTHRREVFDRARYLGAQIRASCGRELGLAGRLLVDWLILALNTIDPEPPPPQSVYVRLLLHRYMVEATVLAHSKPSPDVVTRLSTLVDEEAETMRHVILATGAEGPDLAGLQDAMVRRPDEAAETAFLRFRSLVARILQTPSRDGHGRWTAPYERSTSPAGKMIQGMVDRSSEQLTSVWAGFPPHLRDQKEGGGGLGRASPRS
jgi:hypothetical protein